ncbi:hypothetical protein ESA94_02005 [Lacibacter luteus]|uniref:Uncharacterized protein n=1 Tax=Lacibacter luteus TaxID=2508719 RepID=A0A4Q1CLG5_9BACT|nr:hypothetical protein [Lacibacter luteus]RXK61810.1 hypothetical protein ESA94_02005 [Lacibacter luteus]
MQYSKSAIKDPGGGTLKLLANVNGFHHLIYFGYAKKPVVYVFNSQMQLESRKELNISIPENCDVRLLQLKDHYVLYTHTDRPSAHRLMRINRDGLATDISNLLNKPADSLWNRSKATFQLFNHNDSLYLIAHSYHNEQKKIKTTIVQPKSDAGVSPFSQVLFPFDFEYDELKEVTLLKKQLLVLKTSRDEDAVNTLMVIKTDLLTGNQFSKQFESGKYVYHNPTLRYNTADSSVFVYSLLRTPFGYRGARPELFMARLNSKLNELNPVQTLPNIFKGNAASAFMVEKTQTLGWMCFSYDQRAFGRGGRMPSNQFSSDYMDETRRFTDNWLNPFVYDENMPTAVSMTLLKNNLERKTDSIVKNTGSYYKIHPAPFAQFVLQNTAYLLLIEELAARKKGLLLVSPGENGELNLQPLRVHDQFNFLLSLVQPAGDHTFIIPFTNKNEMGLMKVTLTN